MLEQFLGLIREKIACDADFGANWRPWFRASSQTRGTPLYSVDSFGERGESNAVPMQRSMTWRPLSFAGWQRIIVNSTHFDLGVSANDGDPPVHHSTRPPTWSVSRACPYRSVLPAGMWPLRGEEKIVFVSAVLCAFMRPVTERQVEDRNTRKMTFS